jgi:hypothetical protein
MSGHAPTARTVGLTAGVAATALAATYHFAWRRKITTWGATPDEVRARLPGDELSAGADLVTTRAVAIGAPPGRIWPWLVQMGSGRAGGYSYDWLANRFGLDMHSANVILPQFQQIKRGDEFGVGRHGTMAVEAVEPERWLVLRYCRGNLTSSFVLFPAGRTTRLVIRNRLVLPRASAAVRLFWTLLAEPTGLLLERKMLLGVKQRAERTADAPPASASV